VVEEFAGILKSFKIRTVHGDRYAGEWPPEQFSRWGAMARTYLVFGDIEGKLDVLRVELATRCGRRIRKYLTISPF
jgi:hypothetical protein